MYGRPPSGRHQEEQSRHRSGNRTQPSQMSGPASRMRSISIGTSGEDAVRGIRSRRCIHGRFCCVKLDDLYRVESTFQTNVSVYKLVKPDAEDDKSTAEFVRRSLCHYPETIYLNLHETHFSFIQDVCMYCYSYRCWKCGNSLCNKASMLRMHERTCTGFVR